MKTTVELRDDVARAMRIYMANNDRSFKEQSAVINELIMKGLECIEKHSTEKR